MNSSFDDYIAAAPAEAQGRLLEILELFAQRFPTVQQRINHSVPAFTTGWGDMLRVAAHRDHLNIYVGRELVDSLKQSFPQYEYSKLAVKVAHCQPFPDKLLEEICRLISEENRITRDR